MHTTKYKYQVDILQKGEVIFQHHGSFSGDVIIHHYEDIDIEEDVKTVRIPFKAIKELVAEYVRSKKIQKIEDAELDDLLGL